MGPSLKNSIQNSDSVIDMAYKNVLRDLKVTRDIIKSELRKESSTSRHERGQNEKKYSRAK